MPRKTLIILADGFEEIEAITVIDILRRAGIEVLSASLSGTKVTGSHNITLIADKNLSDAIEEFDACVLPGGMPGASNLAADSRVSATLQKMFKEEKLIAAICASPAVVLAPLGILNGRSATCFAGMEKQFDKSTRFKNDPVVIDGNVITSRGPATALLFALAIVEKLAGLEMKEKLRKATLTSEQTSAKS